MRRTEPWAMLALAIVGAFAAGCGRGRQRPSAPTIGLSSCVLSDPAGGGSVSARCGSLTVPERRDRPDGRSIALRVAVVRADSAEPAADAVVFLPGGPGQAATEQLPKLGPALAEVAGARDLVAVDQRGTGGSGRLRCPEPRLVADPGALRLADELAYVSACARALDADPAGYTTAESALDLEDARAALGYEQLDLVGVSYGTRLALAYALRFPQRVRTLVLDGVAPLEVPIGGDADRDARAALEAIAGRCRRQPGCAARFGDFVRELEQLVAALAAHPRRLTVAHPRTGEPVDVTLTATLVRRTVLLLMYSSDTAAVLPMVVHEASARGALDRLAAQAVLVSDAIGRGISEPLYLSVLCAEDVPFYRPLAAAGGFLGESERGRLTALCARWPHASVGAAAEQALDATTPALLVSGTADPVTPPRYGDLAAEHLPRSIHLVLSGQGHDNLFRGCLPHLVATFVDQGGRGPLDASCARAIEPMAFFVDGGGPPP